MYLKCRFNVLVLFSFFFIVLISNYNFAMGSGNFVKINLPKGLELDFPQNWIVFSKNQRITLDSSVESRLDLSDLPNPDSKLPFAANYYSDAGETIGIANVRYYPNIDLSQDDSRQATSQDVYELDAALKENRFKPMKAFGMSILSWNGTKKVDINGLTSFITEYRRKSYKGSGVFRVRLVRVLASRRSFTLTVSYLESAEVYLRPITDRIINSIKLTYNYIPQQSDKAESDSASTQSAMPGVRNDLNDIQKIVKKARAGNPEAQCTLGKIYFDGVGITQDFKKAEQWYRKSAEHGNAEAQQELGYMYNKGIGVSQNFTQAMKWFRKSAKQGNALGQCNIGILYVKGLGVPQDFAEAMIWFNRAARQNLADAQYMIGHMYANGLGVSQDYKKAASWFLKAARQGDAMAQNNLAILYEEGSGVKQSYNDAANWYRKAAIQGNKTAQYNLGCLYDFGRGVNQSYEEAAKWYEKAALQGMAAAQYNLGSLFYEGLGVPEDSIQCYAWLKISANQGLASAIENLKILDKILTNEQKIKARAICLTLLKDKR